MLDWLRIKVFSKKPTIWDILFKLLKNRDLGQLKAEPSLMFEWELRVQAFQNSVILAMCNRVGTEGNMCFSGESIVVDAKGDVLAKADDTEQILYVDIDMQESLKIRNAKPYTQLRRPDFYL